MSLFAWPCGLFWHQFPVTKKRKFETFASLRSAMWYIFEFVFDFRSNSNQTFDSSSLRSAMWFIIIVFEFGLNCQSISNQNFDSFASLGSAMRSEARFISSSTPHKIQSETNTQIVDEKDLH